MSAAPHHRGRPLRTFLRGFATLILALALGSQNLAAATEEAKETIPFETEAKDGTVLRGHVTMPGGGGPFASILELSPYFNTQAGGDTSQGPTTRAQREYLDAGFAIAQVNMRGTGLSDGCLRFGDRVEWRDASDFVSLLSDAEERGIGRVQMDLRHWKSPGRQRDFPLLEPTSVKAPSGPFAAFVPAGHRLVLFVAGGSAELEPDQFQPTLTITTGEDTPGSIRIPVVKGQLEWGK